MKFDLPSHSSQSIFSVKSPERKVIDSPIMWKDDYSDIAIIRRYKTNSQEKINIHYFLH